MRIPAFVLRKLYVPGSLRREPDGVRFVLRNTLATATLTELRSLRVAGQEVPPGSIRVRVEGADVDLARVSAEAPWVFRRTADAEVHVRVPVAQGAAQVRLEALSAEFGELLIEFEDQLEG
jgi:hypothetical protein